MSDALISKLQHFTQLSGADKAALRRMTNSNVRTYRAGEDIMRQGDDPRHVNIVLDGWAWRFKYLEDGRRQVTSLFLPGDVCDLYMFVLRRMDHFVGAITNVTIARVTRELFDDVTLDRPRILESLLWDSLVSIAIQREWTLSLGQRSAYERVAHLYCETFVRLKAVGRVDGDTCEWPLRQNQMADVTGLSTVHINRTIRDLKEAELIVVEGRKLTVPDLEALEAAALLDREYLHLDREGRHLDANEP